MTEAIANRFRTTLTADVDDTTVTIPVASVTGAPSGGDWRLSVEDELMLVTGVSSLNLTVTRGVEGTTAEAHVDTSPAVHVLTAAALNALIAAGGGGGGSSGLLGVNSYGTSGPEVYTRATVGMADVDATNMAVTFDAPPSGDVLVRLSAWVDVNTSATNGMVGIIEGSTLLAATVVQRDPSDEQFLSIPFLISGLAAGSHTFKWAFGLGTGGAGTFRIFAGDGSGVGWGPAVIEVWDAAPSDGGGGGSGTVQVNVATLENNAVATASSTYSSHYPSLVLDTDPGTVWEPGAGPSGEWLEIDLGMVQTIGSFRFVRDTGYRVSTYMVESSTDGTSWSTVLASHAASGDDELVVITPTTARYWRWSYLSGAGFGIALIGCYAVVNGGGGGGGGSTSVTAGWDGGGSAIAGAPIAQVVVPFAGTIASWVVIADQSTDASIDIWASDYAGFPPDVTDSIVGATAPGLSGALKNTGSDMTGWTTSVAAGDILLFVLSGVDNAEQVVIQLVLA